MWIRISLLLLLAVNGFGQATTIGRTKVPAPVGSIGDPNIANITVLWNLDGYPWLDEFAGNTLTNLGGTIETVQSVFGNVGRAAKFSQASNMRLQASHSGSIKMTNTAWTIAGSYQLLAFPSSGTNAWLLLKGQASTSDIEYGLRIIKNASGNWLWSAMIGQTNSGGDPLAASEAVNDFGITLGVTYLIAFGWDGSTGFMNIAENSPSTSVQNYGMSGGGINYASTNVLSFGTDYEYQAPTACIIDRVAIYNIALDVNTVLALFRNAGVQNSPAVAAGSVPLTGNGAGLTNLHTSWTNTFNVKDYGAKGDGVTDDTPAFRSASTAAGIGGIIIVPYGTFLLTNFNALTNGQMLLGYGAQSVLQHGPTVSSDGSILTIPPQVSNVTVRGIYFDSNPTAATAGSLCVRCEASIVRFSDCFFDNTRAGGVLILASTAAVDDVTIMNCVFVNGGYGVGTSTASTLAITRVRTVGCTFTGGSRGNAIDYDCPNNECYEFLASDNLIRGYTNLTAGGAGIALAHIKSAVIHGNTIFNGDHDGAIHIEDGSSAIAVSGNIISNTVNGGIVVNAGGSSSRIVHGITIGDNLIVNAHTGTVDNKGGIEISGTTVRAYDIAIHHNIVRNTGNASVLNSAGIYIKGGTNVTCTDNTVVNTAGTTNAGIRILGPVNNSRLTGNRCYDDQSSQSQQYGLIVKGACLGCWVHDNDFTGNLTGDILNYNTAPIGFYDNNAQADNLNTTTNNTVGISTNNPQAKVHIVGLGRTASLLKLGTSAADGLVDVNTNGNVTITAAPGAANGPPYIAIGTNTADYRYIGDPRDFMEIGPEYFIGVFPASTTAASGIFQWIADPAGSGVALARLAGTSQIPGGWQVQSGTQATNRESFRTAQSIFVFGGGRTTLEVRVRIPTLSDSTDTFTAWAGFGDVGSAAGDQTDGFYAIYSTTNLYYTNTSSWSAKTANNASYTEIPSTTNVVANTWYLLRFDVNAAGNQADFYIGDTLIGSSTTTIPTAAGREFGITFKIEKSNGTTSRNLDVDYVYWRLQRTTRL